MISLLLTLVGSLLLDGAVRPRPERVRQWQGMLLHLLTIAALFGLCLAVSGSEVLAAGLTLAATAFFTLASNAKHDVLGEPLLFSDLALVAGLFRHPQFYLAAVSRRDRVLAVALAPTMVIGLAWLYVPRLTPHLVGFALMLAAGAGLWLSMRSRWCKALAPSPAIDSDLARYGLIATVLLYWRRWRDIGDPLPCAAVPARTDYDPEDAPVIVVVQCESFADPVELTGTPDHALAGLQRARALAWQWGDLQVSGFGAYTMRTEYGLLFGRSEAELSFRRYDPFLTAHREASYALSARLRGAGYRSLFIHPHDMRFYQRDRLMPSIGFERLIGEESFAPAHPDQGRYVDDRAVGAMLGDLVDGASQPTLLYAVTMENHGPWGKDRLTRQISGLEDYLGHLHSSDAMLGALIERLAAAGRSALLVFFGDHRPSIPGVTAPGGARHTPYVVLRFGHDGQIMTGANRRLDLAPHELHHVILRYACGQLD